MTQQDLLSALIAAGVTVLGCVGFIPLVIRSYIKRQQERFDVQLEEYKKATDLRLEEERKNGELRRMKMKAEFEARVTQQTSSAQSQLLMTTSIDKLVTAIGVSHTQQAEMRQEIHGMAAVVKSNTEAVADLIAAINSGFRSTAEIAKVVIKPEPDPPTLTDSV